MYRFLLLAGLTSGLLSLTFDPEEQRPDPPPAPSVAPPTRIEQTAQGKRPSAPPSASFDGLGAGS